MQTDLNELTYFQRWRLAARPKTLPAAVAPVLVGGALAYAAGSFRPLAALAALLGAVLIQIGTNFVNDVADFEKGADTQERLGPMRVTENGLLTPRQVWSGVAVTFGLAALTGVYLIAATGWPVAVIGLASLLGGYIYTAGPWPLAYNGLGDLGVMIFFGFVAVCGTAYVTAGFLPESAWLASLAVGALITNILVVNNIRDIKSDRKAGRRNIPVVFGRAAGEIELVIWFVVAYLVPPLMLLLGQVSGWGLLPLLSIPLAVRLVSYVKRTDGFALNQGLAQMAQLALVYSALFAVGIVFGS
jgi:1,4-dihydroxy-2-naphthoate octaprenyltransferase